MRLVESLAERGEFFLDALSGSVVAETCCPQHTAGVLAATVNLATLVDLLHDRRRGGCDVGFGIALKHLLEGFFELVVVLLGYIRQRVDEHELGHEFRQGILAHHLGISRMDLSIVVVQVIVVSPFIHAFLHLLHILEVLKIVRVLHCLSILGVGKFTQYHAAVVLGLCMVAVAHVHQVEVVVCVKAVDVVRITAQQLGKLESGRIEVLEFVLQDDTLVEQTLLNHIVRGLNLLGRLGNLLEVVFLVVRILGACQCFLVHLG